ncbi:NAD+ synthase [Actinophytocola oryzae]|uniref:Glutamine-dependent NAD(+) synthetase n=1 Tax=Actinophytocola oryzae TaxID=502181 RepID=A0A4R7VH58_9PSEU|nr:NAD+ synthase [Actinophytocola oryzae]TDV48652.1 NAD+ synthase (glutamine-hydrolysing) [Actinophytocola oryzae]
MSRSSDSGPLRLAVAQLNLVVGDLTGNVGRLREWTDRARDEGAELVLTPELSICGYPPEDLLTKTHFLRDCRAALDEFARDTHDVVAFVGFPEWDGDVYNALAVVADGAVRAVYRKCRLPNYAVFDERRYFAPGAGPSVVEVGDAPVGLSICEDIWIEGEHLADVAAAGAALMVNVAASPFHRGKGVERERMIVQRARDHLTPIAMCNLVGGQDQLVFDGGSVVVDHRGVVLGRAPRFEECLLHVDIDVAAVHRARLLDTRHRGLRAARPAVLPGVSRPPVPEQRRRGTPVLAPVLAEDAEVYGALVLGLRDYVEKNGLGKVCLGVSGGIDSALVLLIAVDALGADRVEALLMPSRYSSAETRADSRQLADNLGVRSHEISIEPAFVAYQQMLKTVFVDLAIDVAEQHLQARIRGTILMAMQNKLGWLVLGTNNKTETSVGYSTLYGDTVGALGVIDDVPKWQVYELVRYRSGLSETDPVPRGIVERPPSAETAFDQRDEDSLPKFGVLDRILELAIEEEAGRERILAETGACVDDVDLVLGLIAAKEFKRHQLPPPLRVSRRAFGRDRRMPITNRYPD